MLDCSSIENLHDLSSSRCEPDWFLSKKCFANKIVREDFFLLIIKNFWILLRI